MYLQRSSEPRLDRYLQLFPAVAITGPRQSGKTTLVRSHLPACPYVSFDDVEEARAAEADPRGFLARFPDRVILDEAQRVPTLIPYLKLEIDRERERKGRFILTGSNQFALTRRLTESLAGRIGLLTLLPFERGELPEAARSSQVVFGSYPELATRGYEGAKEWFSSYVGTYLERDVRAVHGLGRLGDFLDLLKLLAVRTSQEYNASSLGRDLGIDSKTVEAWVSVLEASYILFRLRPYYANLGKRLVKRPKLYFWDTGLLCHLAGLRNVEALEEGPLGGPVFENFVIAEILKGSLHRGRDLEAHFFRESNGLEADLVLQDREAGTTFVLDIKSGKTAKESFLAPLERIATMLSAKRQPTGACPDAIRNAVIYRGEDKPEWPRQYCDFRNYEAFIERYQERSQ
ncbi:MAG TPA: ATP-binding protein [Rectinemataceae bacterium]